MACNGSYATPEDYAAFWCIALGEDEEEAVVQNYLTIAAADIHVALAASGACGCSLADWATDYLKKLNVVGAVVFHKCQCGRPNVTDDLRGVYLELLDRQFELLRTGAIDVCDGATGVDFPAIGWAQQGVTEFAQARIILNDISANG